MNEPWETTQEQALADVRYWREVERRLLDLSEFLLEGGTVDSFFDDVHRLAMQAGDFADDAWRELTEQK